MHIPLPQGRAERGSTVSEFIYLPMASCEVQEKAHSSEYCVNMAYQIQKCRWSKKFTPSRHYCRWRTWQILKITIYPHCNALGNTACSCV